MYKICFVVLVFCLNSRYAVSQVKYLPSIETSITSTIEIGVERTGSEQVIIRTLQRRTDSDSNSETNTRTNTQISRIEETRSQVTNPMKRQTRPKPSGLFGGVARAFGGDFSGLVDWAGGFADHMMEPKYNFDVNKVYYTKEYKETTTTGISTNSFENRQEFEREITQTYSTDINKGFIRFSAALTNIGERSVRIKSPTFLVHFVNSANELVYIGQSQPSLESDNPISIAPNRSYIFGIEIKDYDFISLSSLYRDAIGVVVTVQDVFINFDDEYLTIAEAQESLEDGYVRVDYFDGNNKSIKYYPVSNNGILIRDFLKQILSTKSYNLNEQLSSDQVLDKSILRIGNLKSDTLEFSAMETIQDRYDWHRWFITISDNESTYFDAKLNDSIYPGYSIRIGYYSAEKVLPLSKYEPIVYEEHDVSIKSGEIIDIDFDLRKGDIIKFEDFKFVDITTQVIKFTSERISRNDIEEKLPSNPNVGLRNSSVNPWANPGSYSSIFGDVYVGSYAQNFLILDDFTNPLTEYHKHNNYYKLTPKSAETIRIKLEDLIRIFPEDEIEIPDSLKYLFVRQMFMESMRQNFQHIDDILETDFTMQPVYEGFGYSSLPYLDLSLIMGIAIRAGESVDEYYNRELFNEEDFTFVVEEDIAIGDNRWSFSPLFTYNKIHDTYIQSYDSELPEDIYGVSLGDFYSYGPVFYQISNSGPSRFYQHNVFPKVSISNDNIDISPFYLIALSENLPTSLSNNNYYKPYRALFNEPTNGLNLISNVGLEYSATIKILRFRD